MSSDLELCEYAVYHWNFRRPVNLLGVSNGMPDPNFFSNLKAEKFDNSKIQESLSDLLNATVMNWSGFQEPSLIMCSGGVDSSLVVAGASQCKSNFHLLHTAYVKHDNNDLDKLKGILEQFPVKATVCSLGYAQYFEGLKGLWSHHYVQNTYAPTVYFALQGVAKQEARQLVTGSGPDELFYGMEKYDWNFFKALENVKLSVALEKIDVAYNLSAYLEIFNKKGRQLLEEVQSERRLLYQSIAQICDNIFDAQRLLAYCTVTAQHVSLFDTLGKIFGLQHKAPFLNKELIQLAFSLNTEQLLYRPNGEVNVEIGKKHLKKFAATFFKPDHIYSKKIGFHAPVTKFILEHFASTGTDGIDYECLPSFLDPDRTKKYLKNRLKEITYDDYFLYSILNLVKAASTSPF